MNEFRHDPVTGQLVIISAGRDARPQQFSKDAVPSFEEVEQDPDCPFCCGQMDTPPIITSYSNLPATPLHHWDVCVVANRYPVLDLDSGSSAAGLHEVVIESGTHATRMSHLSAPHYRFMLQAYRDRFVWMANQKGIRFALAMKNSGEDAGASIRHTHSQLFGLTFVPEQMQRELSGCRAYCAKNGCCVFCDLINEPENRMGGSRFAAQSESFVAWCPEASRFAYEVWIAPRTHQSRFETTSDQLLVELAEFLEAIIRKVDRHPRIRAFNYVLHSLPFDSNRYDEYHWHIEILPRISKQAGFEWGTGIFINTVTPERAAQEFRQLV